MKTQYPHANQLPPPKFAEKRAYGLPSALRRQTLSGRSAGLLALIVALALFLASAPTAHAQSSVATLSNLTISTGTLSPAFAPGTISYTVQLPHSVTSVRVTPTASDSNATIALPGRGRGAPATSLTSGSPSPATSLPVGSSNILIRVTAEDGTTRTTYTVRVTRAASNDATLSGLTISPGTLSPTFVTGTTEYTAVVANSVRSVTVTPTANDSSATIRVTMLNGNVVLNRGQTSPARPLGVGPTVIPITVTAQDGVTTKTYTVTVTRVPANASNDATLRTLTISSARLPLFTPGTTVYTTVVANSVRSVTVTPTASVAGATITVGGKTVVSGTASTAQPVKVGYSTIRIIVTAPDRVTTETYTVTVRRVSSNDPTLSGLTLSVGTLTPTFTPRTGSYTAVVPNSVSSVTLTPTANHGGATITMVGGRRLPAAMPALRRISALALTPSASS